MDKKTSIILLLWGLILTALTCLLWHGLGWWSLPGLTLLATGVAGLACRASRAKGCCCIGIYLLLLGAMGLVAALPQMLLGLAEIVSIVLMAGGALLFIVGMKVSKPREAIAA